MQPEAEMRSLTCADLTDPDTLVDDLASVQRLIDSEHPDAEPLSSSC